MPSRKAVVSVFFVPASRTCTPSLACQRKSTPKAFQPPPPPPPPLPPPLPPPPPPPPPQHSQAWSVSVSVCVCVGSHRPAVGALGLGDVPNAAWEGCLRPSRVDQHVATGMAAGAVYTTRLKRARLVHERLVEPCGGVAREDAHEDEEQQHRRHQTPAVGPARDIAARKISTHLS